MQLREKELTAAEEKVTALSGTKESKVDKSVPHFHFIQMSICD